jgi:hypothetical protein
MRPTNSADAVDRLGRFMSGEKLSQQEPPSPQKRWLVKIAGAPLLFRGMILAWGVLLLGDRYT